MNTKYLRLLDSLFEYNGDALILSCLYGQGELRFTELARQMVDRSGVHRPDALLTRNLPRLREAGFVVCDGSTPRRPVYSLTSEGRRQAEVLAFVLDSLADRYDESVLVAP